MLLSIISQSIFLKSYKNTTKCDIINNLKYKGMVIMQDILEKFALASNVVHCKPYGNGHINKTYDVLCKDGSRYVLQGINSDVFKNVPELMKNIELILAHLKDNINSDEKVLSLVPTLDGKTYYKHSDGSYWRVWDFIGDSLCLDRANTAEDFYQSALAFGRFANAMNSFDAKQLSETIPSFHDTRMRFKQLRQAIEKDACNRVSSVKKEIDFALSREDKAGIMLDMQEKGKLPLRVTHNDTKLNNVMLDANTRKALCVIDLDCVMPGLLGNDFGDSIRFGASTADEDEQDLSRVHFSLDLFESYTKGYMEACGNSMTGEEISTLALAAILMTLECGIRFLADYINGDKYFSISRESHNLDRCRTQFKLVKEMEDNYENMQAIVFKYTNKA